MVNLSNNDINNLNHILMAGNAASNTALSNNDWMFDSGASWMMVKNWELMINYFFLSNPLHFSDVNGKSLMAYDTDIAWIWMEHMDILMKKAYYILTVIANLLCNHDLFIFSYWIKLLQDFLWKIIEQSFDIMVGLIIPFNRLYIIRAWQS